jgi:DNA invertase Pin-like site-specific DNA recombinase
LDKQAFIGAGEGAYKGKHLKTKDGVAVGALAKFIQAVEKGEIKSGSALCIDSVDRFQRQEIMSALEPFTKLLNLGIGIVFTGSYHKKLLTLALLNKEPHWLQIVINDMIRSWMESDEKSRKIKSSKERKRKEIMSGKPVPHNNAPQYFTWTKEKQVYEHNGNTQTVRRIVKMYLGGSSLYGIAKTFNKEGVPTFRKDAAWSSNAVRCIMRNRSLIGEFFGNKTFFPRIVSDGDFARVQALLAHNKSFNRGKEGTLTNVFRGTAYCKCGMSMNVLTQRLDPHTKKPHAVPYRYLRCSTKGNGRGCLNSHVVRLDDMEEEFFGNFLLQDPKSMVADKSQAEELNANIAKARLRIGDLTQRIEKLIAVDMDVPELKQKLTALTKQRDVGESAMDALIVELGKVETAPGHFDDLKALCFGFDSEPDGETHFDRHLKFHMSPKAKAFDDAIQRMNETLKDNAVRMKIRTMLPSLVGRIVVHTSEKRFEVFNHSGKCIYKSLMGQFEKGVFALRAGASD